LCVVTKIIYYLQQITTWYISYHKASIDWVLGFVPD